MANLNKVQLIGNVTRDPEVKYTPKGSAVTDLGLAINRFYTTDSGEKREEATFVEVTLWGRQAEVAGEYCKKGRPVYIEGRLQLDSWEDKATGQKRNKLRVIGENLQLLGSRSNGSSGETTEVHQGREEKNYQRSSRPATGSSGRFSQTPSSSSINDEDDDIPF